MQALYATIKHHIFMWNNQRKQRKYEASRRVWRKRNGVTAKTIGRGIGGQF